jgi:SAM domain (Sterile alpha motif)
MDVGDWLRTLGFERYQGAFRDNEIDETVLPNLTAEDLKELGVSALGHRRKLLDAIAFDLRYASRHLAGQKRFKRGGPRVPSDRNRETRYFDLPQWSL